MSTSLLVPIGIYDMHYMDFFLDTNVIKGRSVLQNWEKEQEKLSDGVPIVKENSGKVLHVFPHRL